MRIVQHLDHIVADLEQTGTGELVLHLITDTLTPIQEKQLQHILSAAATVVEASLKLADLL